MESEENPLLELERTSFCGCQKKQKLKRLLKKGEITENDIQQNIMHKVETWTTSADLYICKDEEASLGEGKVVSKVFPPPRVIPDDRVKREISLLKTLNEYTAKYPCECGPHFPKLISCKKNVPGSSSNMAICISNQGIDLQDLKDSTYKITIKNLEQQLSCIGKTFREC